MEVNNPVFTLASISSSYGLVSLKCFKLSLKSSKLNQNLQYIQGTLEPGKHYYSQQNSDCGKLCRTIQFLFKKINCKEQKKKKKEGSQKCRENLQIKREFRNITNHNVWNLFGSCFKRTVKNKNKKSTKIYDLQVTGNLNNNWLFMILRNYCEISFQKW